MADLTGMMQAAAGATGGANPNAWDISKAYYDAGSDAWDVSTAGLAVLSFSVAAQETNPSGLFFKPDGTKMYVCGTIGDDVNEYTLSTPWLVTSASYVQNFSVATQDTAPQDLFFKPDGTKMYVVGNASDNVNEYNLSSAWDISTASYTQNFSVATEETNPNGLFFKPDGTKMYITGATGDDVNEYSLSTPWDISTASYVQNFSVAAQDTAPDGLFFKPDGTKMYISGTTNDDIFEYDLSSAWDISTASYVQTLLLPYNPTALFFHPDGSALYVVDSSVNGVVYQYAIGGFSVAAQETAPQDLFFKPDGTKMYIVGSTGDDVNEYDLSTAWDILSASYLQNFSVVSQEENPRGLFFKPDGTKMYICGNTSLPSGDRVNEYDLSSAWDISTASHVQSFDVGGQETVPESLSFKPDGTKMYVLGSTGDDVNEYDLGTPWDISTASYLQNFSVATQETTPRGLFFKPDGTIMYVIGANGIDINEYALSTPWDISTASYLQNFSVEAQELNPQGIFWKDDGTQFWIVGSTNDKVLSYLISPE